MPLSLFSVGYLLLGMQPIVPVTSKTPLREYQIFICKWSSIEDCFLVRDGLLLSALGPHLVQTHAGPLHAASVSCVSYWFRGHCLYWFRGHCFLGDLHFSHTHPTLTLFLSLLHGVPWTPREQVLWSSPLFGLSVPILITLHKMSSRSSLNDKKRCCL